MQELARDTVGKLVKIGARVRVLSISGNWLDQLDEEEKQDVLSMIGETFEVEEIDEYGHPWVLKWWRDEENGTSYGHGLALEPHEMELVEDVAP